MLVEKPLIGQTVIAPYMKDAKYDILFTMKIYRYEILQRRILGADASFYEILSQISLRKTEVTAVNTI